MFELEEYSSGFHDGFLNKYAVSLEKKPNLFYCVFVSIVYVVVPPSVSSSPPPQIIVCWIVIDLPVFLDFYSIILQKEDEQEIHVCMYSKNIYTCV